MQTVRHHALDNLRAFIIFLVVVLHASLSYMAYAPEWWYVLDPERSLAFTALVLLIDVPIMLILGRERGDPDPPAWAAPHVLMGHEDRRVRFRDRRALRAARGTEGAS